MCTLSVYLYIYVQIARKPSKLVTPVCWYVCLSVLAGCCRHAARPCRQCLRTIFVQVGSSNKRIYVFVVFTMYTTNYERSACLAAWTLGLSPSSSSFFFMQCLKKKKGEGNKIDPDIYIPFPSLFPCYSKALDSTFNVFLKSTREKNWFGLHQDLAISVLCVQWFWIRCCRVKTLY